MRRSLAIPIYIASAIAAVFVAHHLIYYISPIFAWLHPIARAVSGLVACFSVLIVAYQRAVNELDGTARVAIWSSGLWAMLALTSPAIERDVRWTVQGLVGDNYDEHEITHQIVCHCWADAETTARSLFKDHKNWPREYADSVYGVKPSEVPETDVRIECYSTTPSLDWINAVLGTRFGTKFYTTTLRYIDDGKDPFRLITDLYRPEEEYDRYDY